MFPYNIIAAWKVLHFLKEWPTLAELWDARGFRYDFTEGRRPTQLVQSEPMEWPDPADNAHVVEQAGGLRDKAAAGGLKFEAYLPPDLAVWLLDRIEQGKFIDPSEAAFVLLGEARDLEPHADLRNELLKRSIQAAIDDPRPSIPAEEVWQSLQNKFDNPLPEPAKWEKRTGR